VHVVDAMRPGDVAGHLYEREPSDPIPVQPAPVRKMADLDLPF
jgi:hypothetical protein